MSAWVGSVTALIGVLIGGGLAHYSATSRAVREKRWEVIRHKQDKLEELSTVLDAFENSYREISGAALLKLEKDQVMKLEGSRIPSSRMTTLIEFYAPELLERKKELDTLTEEYGKILAKVIESSGLNRADKMKLMEKVLSGHKSIEDTCKKMASEAAKIVQKEVAYESSNK